MTLSMDQILQHLAGLAKPPGSLGKLEQLTAQLAWIQQTLEPQTQPRELILFAADHGIVEEEVSAWPQAVTAWVVDLARQGRSASAALAEACQTRLRIVDVGTVGPAFPEAENYACRKVRAGTRNWRNDPAMTLAEFEQARQIGVDEAARARAAGARILAAGEVGIGNTTSAAAVIALVTKCPAEMAVGPGAGADQAQLERKRRVVEIGVDRARLLLEQSPEAAFAEVAGYELVAMMGFYLEAARQRIPIVLDGVISTAAALMAIVLEPACRDVMIAAHRSPEPAHSLALDRCLRLNPYLDGWQLRLGEGTGALLLMPMLDACASLLERTARLSDLNGVEDSSPVRLE